MRGSELAVAHIDDGAEELLGTRPVSLGAEELAEIEHAYQRLGVAQALGALPPGHGPSQERLCLVVGPPHVQQRGQVVHREQRVRVVFPEGAFRCLEHAFIDLLRAGVLALGLQQVGHARERDEGLGVVRPTRRLARVDNALDQGLCLAVALLARENDAQVVHAHERGSVCHPELVLSSSDDAAEELLRFSELPVIHEDDGVAVAHREHKGTIADCAQAFCGRTQHAITQHGPRDGRSNAKLFSVVATQGLAEEGGGLVHLAAALEQQTQLGPVGGVPRVRLQLVGAVLYQPRLHERSRVLAESGEGKVKLPSDVHLHLGLDAGHAHVREAPREVREGLVEPDRVLAEGACESLELSRRHGH
mmetsp:Transcript_24426/g.76125  ORF Transcript_24426/g.76125 Transcript_24426/m.76125 type:complete len:362 (+) Transcript_24426:388-1473(+)